MEALALFLIGTVTFVLLWSLSVSVIAAILHRNTQNPKDLLVYQSMAKWLTALAVFFMYLMWISCYLHQLYPLIIPDLTGEIEKELRESERYKCCLLYTSDAADE
eukprot:TRINITY_DN19757_c0_g1_i1.p1 TRINITY_DN19757_c0_g1~~TRINITY_DN19757_c0_g1_i1.p1  ORF type:complete len:105 (+),score=28.50 TRINITY_DN19757_c0_g1_i1:11-325(+)